MFFLEVNLLNHKYIESRHVYDVMPYLTDPFSGSLKPAHLSFRIAIVYHVQ